jgi:transposase
MSLIFRSQQAFEQEVIMKKLEGWTIRALSRSFQISRNTVRRILREHDVQRERGHDALPKKCRKPSKLDVFEPQITKLLTAFPNITGQRIFEELQREGFPGTCVSGCRRKTKYGINALEQRV